MNQPSVCVGALPVPARNKVPTGEACGRSCSWGGDNTRRQAKAEFGNKRVNVWLTVSGRYSRVY